jgi:hypothetical protein
MTTVGGQPGNENGRGKNRTRHALMRALARRKGSVRAGLDEVADEVAKLAAKGERWAVEFVRDTVDGKPVQAISGPGGTPLSVVTRIELVPLGDGKS